MRKLRAFAAALIVLVAGSACNDATGPDQEGTLTVRFATLAGAGGAGGGSAGLLVEGSNGTLDITDVRLIVAEFELEGADDRCEGAGAGDDCSDFEAGPAFIRLPLEGAGALAVRWQPRAGLYDELEFEIERLDDDDDEDAERALLAEIRAQIPEWPRKASVRVDGTFTPVGGAPRPFRTYIDAEIEIEMDLVPPIAITAEDGAEITVEVDPRLWFDTGNGRVFDLSAWDWITTGRLLELEIELERGFRRIRHDD